MRRNGTTRRLTAAVLALALPTAASAKMTAEERIEQLERALRQAQEQIQDLRQEVQTQKQAQQATEKQVQQATEQATEATKTASTVESIQKKIPAWLEKVTLFGDTRIRYEGFYHQPHPDGQVTTARNRGRYRFRVGLKLALTDEVQTVFRLASGNPNDPISTNQTFTDAFTRKSINLDWAYLTVTPGKTFGWRPGVFSITGGKMPNPMFKPDELLWDNDLAPEGVAERVQLLAAPVAFLDQFNVHAFQWSFAEVSNAQDGWVFGGQLNPQGHAFGTATWEMGLGQTWYLNPDDIAVALNSNKQLTNTNAVITDDGSIVGYESGFNMTDVSGQVVVPDVHWGMPLIPFAHYVHNWQGVTNATDGAIAGVRFGRPTKRGDWAVVAQYNYLEREAVLSAFSWSNFGLGGTNQKGPMVQVDYQLLDPLILQARAWFTNYIDTLPGLNNPTMTRFQLDAMVKF